MKARHSGMLVVFLEIIAVSGWLSAQPISDIIPPLRLVAGQPDTVWLADLFYAEDYRVEFEPHPHIDWLFHPETFTLRLIADKDFEGLTLLPFHYRGKRLVIPILVEIRQTHRFRYRPAQPVGKLTLFGSFNSWNRDNLPLRDPDGDGVYEIEIPLEPGRYEYKFHVDGEEVIDPENPHRVPNPFGSYNSVITIPSRHPERFFLHLVKTGVNRRYTELTFAAELAGRAALPDSSRILALLDNQEVAEAHISVRGNRIRVHLPAKRLSGKRVFRIAATGQGMTTPMQTVVLHDGQPAHNTSPFSWNDAIIYSLMIDRFLDGNPHNTRRVEHPQLAPQANFHGGDLEGVLQKLQEGYFDSLGVNVLWLSPVNQNPDKAYREWPPPHRYFSAYHGYWPVHHQKVDDRFGTLELLKQVVETAHQHGLKVLLDFVSNHVHIDHPFYREHREWFGVPELPDGRPNIRLWDEHRLTTWFEPFLPSFDYLGSEEALQTMTDNAVWWLKQTGIDGFRHDAVKHVPNRFWRTLTRKIRQRINPHRQVPIFQIGETFGSYDLISSYVNNGQLDAQFNFNLFFTARHVFLTPEADFSILEGELQKTFAVYGMHHRMGNLMDSHDQVRYMAYADGDLSLTSGDAREMAWTNPPQVDHPSSYRKVELYLAYLLSIPGVPIIYYGDEIGMTGAADPDNRRPMRFGDQLTPAEREMFRRVSRLIRLRRQHPALRYGDFYTLHADSLSFAYLRSDMNERVLVILNRSEKPRTLAIPLPELYPLSLATSLKSGEKRLISDHVLPVKVGAFGWEMWRIE